MNDRPALPFSRSGKPPSKVAIEATMEAGSLLKDHFRSDASVQKKGKRNLVTEIDLLSEKIIVSILRNEYPDHGILCEESGEIEGMSEYQWIIDPLDGTTNYAFGIPHFCVSIAMVSGDRVLLGVVYDPLRGELFRSELGKGAFLNDAGISVKLARPYETTVVGLDLGYDDAETREMLFRIGGAWSGEIAYRLMGSATLGITYVACGRMDIYIHRSLYPWDIAGALLLLREAGGEIVDWAGKPATPWAKKVIACSSFEDHILTIDALRGINEEVTLE